MTIAYADKANPDLLDRMPQSARLLLDVGCGTGALGAAYKRLNPGCRVLGIEQDAAAAGIAASRLDAVFAADLNVTPLPFADAVTRGTIDCMIYGDVLEHLHDPWDVLARHLDYLSPDGTVLLCLPNLEHWSIAATLLRGTWDYKESGLLDATHLRWFSEESTRRALAELKLHVVEVLPRIFDHDSAHAFVDALEPALARLGVAAEDYLRRAAPVQYVWRLRRTPPPPLTIVSTVISPMGGVSHVRVIEPMRAIASESDVEGIVIASGDSPPDVGDTPKIFIFHRPLLVGTPSLEKIRALLAQNWLLVCEFDDNPDHIAALAGKDVLNFRAVHAVQTSTAPLAEVLRRSNPETAIFPNAIAALPDIENYRSPEVTTLFFAGFNREADWPPYLAALNGLARHFGPRLQFQIVADATLFQALETPFKTFTPICDYATYHAILARSEISFMPLLDNEFNRCKSDLKFIEAAAHRVTAVASRVVYQPSIRDRETGLLFGSAEELLYLVGRIVEENAFGRQIADRARAAVIDSRMLAYQVRDRIAWYRSLLARRPVLERALLARTPELRLAGAISV